MLVAGLLTVGAVADAEHVFDAAARAIVRPDARPIRVLAGLLGLTALTAAVLNLDTAAAFLTPVLILAARELQADELPFVYGAVLMANAGSLFLVGSNLTNLLVLGDRASGSAFFVRLLPAALVSVAVTAGGVLAWAWQRARGTRGTRGAQGAVVQSRPRRPPTTRAPIQLGPGIAAIVIAAGLIIATRRPALPVAAAGALAAMIALHRGTIELSALRKAVGPLSLVGLFLVAVSLGTLAREWSGPARLLASAGSAATAAIAATTSVVINNLPAASLLSAHRPEHPDALLIGLDLGPNLAVTGSLAVLIWWRATRRLGVRVSARRYSMIGAPLALLAGTGALVALRLT